MSKRILRIIYICFLLSGAAGLIYEVVWSRQLALFLGSTTYAHTAVLAAFMGGLGAGSLVFGRLSDRLAQPLRLYAWLEVGIGLCAFATIWMFPWLQSLYASAAGDIGITGASSHLLRFSLAFFSLLLPTFLMGGTLPPLIRGLTKGLPDLARSTGRLYGINTLGAALGAFAAGYFLLPAVGIRSSILVGIFINFGVAAVVLVLGRTPKTAANREEAVPVPQTRVKAGQPLPSTAAIVLLIGFALSGFVALSYQSAWIRALTLVIGSSVYSFSTTLTTFLIGLAVGSLLFARVFGDDAEVGQRMGDAALTQMGIGIFALLGLFLIGQLPELFLRGYQAGLQQNFILFQAFMFGLSFLIMFLPTLLLGMLFPLITALWTQSARTMGQSVGTVYAANTLGTLFGALVTGLILLPLLGVQTTIILMVGLQILIGVVFWLVQPPTQTATLTSTARYGVIAGVAAIFTVIVLIVPGWDQAVMSSGTYMNADWLLRRNVGQSLKGRVQERELLFYEEGIDGVVTVVQSRGQRILSVNGKGAASTVSDLPTHVMLGQLPLLLHTNPENVLVIGLGSGVTTNSVATHSTPKLIDVVEVSPEVVKASDYFKDVNRDVLEDDRVNVIVGDGRNFVLSETQQYDVIISQPSNPWITGVSNLFTREAFELSKSKLAPGGLMAQWFQTYKMNPTDVRIVLKTFKSIFPHVTVWSPQPGDLILIGSEEALSFDWERLTDLISVPDIEHDLDQVNRANPRQLFGMFWLGEAELSAYTVAAPLNTDDRPRVEFKAPRNLYRNTTRLNDANVIEFLNGKMQTVPSGALGLATHDGIEAPGLGLIVRMAGPINDDDWEVVWLVDRLIVPMSQGNEPFNISQRSQGQLSWREGQIDALVAAFHVPVNPSAEQLKNFLQEPLLDSLVQSGIIDMSQDKQGQWAITHSDDIGTIRIIFAWSCPDPLGGYLQYIADHEAPDPGRDLWMEEISSLASRYQCLEM